MRTVNATKEQLKESIAALGNTNHWQHWTASLESTIQANAENPKILADDVHYVCWLLLSAEYVCYHLKCFLYFKDELQRPDVFDDNYNALLKKAPAEIHDEVKFAIYIRHLLIHKGFPNPHNKPSNNGRPPEEAEIWRIRNFLSDGANLEQIKDSFNRVHDWLRSNRTNVEITY